VDPQNIERNIRLLAVRPNREDLIAVTQLCEQSKIIPVIDRIYALPRTAEAMRYVGERHAKGKVIISLEDS
jgi:NADPH:quinone reductase-like Zn-dependent oxidoreductase